MHGDSAVFAVFAVFASNHQPSPSRFPQESWAADGLTLTNERTVGRAPAVLPLFS
jgi:hypothetical protein